MKELNEQTIGCPDVISMEDGNWRVDKVENGSAFAIRMDTPHTIKRYSLDDVLDRLEDGTYRKVENIQRPPVSFTLSEEESGIMAERQKVIEQLLEDENPSWERLTVAGAKNKRKHEAAEKLGITPKYFSRLMERYLCSGRNQYSLLDNRRFNHIGKDTQNGLRSSMGLRPLDETEPVQVEAAVNGYTEDEIFDTGYKYFMDNKKVQDAYDRMIYDFYRVDVDEGGRVKRKLMPKKDRPSYNRFYRYIRDRIGGRKITDFKKGPLNERNNLREFTGNTQSGVTTIGQVFMMDECEVGIYLVDSKTHSKVVGKPVVYIILDAVSWMIVGCYIGFDNNSYAGFCNSFASMLEPHENQTSRYGVHCTQDEFPSMVIPQEIFVDLGAEYRSKAVENVAQPLGMKITFTSPGCGSLKGAVESTHKRIQMMLADAVNKCGQITYGVGNDNKAADKARNEAVLTIETFRAMVYKVILELNQSTLKGYEPPMDMKGMGIPLTPKDIWKYETDRFGSPVNITEENHMPILFDLMMDDREFEIGRNGIKSSKYNLFYRTDAEWFRQMQMDNGKRTEIRYDPEHIETVYVRYKKEIHAVPFADRHEELDSYKGLTWIEYEAVMKEEENEEREDEEYLRRLQAKHELLEMTQNEKRLKNGTKNQTKNIKENRREERKRLKSRPDEDKTRMENGLPEPEEMKFIKDEIPEDEILEDGFALLETDLPGTDSSGTDLPECDSDESCEEIDLFEVARHRYD